MERDLISFKLNFYLKKRSNLVNFLSSSLPLAHRKMLSQWHMLSQSLASTLQVAGMVIPGGKPTCTMCSHQISLCHRTEVEFPFQFFFSSSAYIKKRISFWCMEVLNTSLIFSSLQYKEKAVPKFRAMGQLPFANSKLFSIDNSIINCSFKIYFKV